jgi:probable HAF family extracellular repeat protein
VLAPAYSFVDVGPPPDSNSYVLVEDMNEPGQAVGSYLIDDGLFGSFHAFLWDKGAFTDLGAPEGALDSFPVKVNNRGQVLCNSLIFDGPAFVGYQPWIWEKGVRTEISQPADFDYIEVVDMNNRGQVVGNFSIGDETHAFLWNSSVLTDLGNLGAPFFYAFASDINDSGQVVGASAAVDRRLHAFLWGNGEMSDLGLFNDSTRTVAGLINNRGQIAGFMLNRNTGVFDLFFWDRGHVTALGTGLGSDVQGLNDKGEIIGVTFKADKTWHGFFWRSGELTDLTFPGAVNLAGPYTVISDALDINERSQVVGWSTDVSGEEGHAFLWNSGVLSDLDSSIPGFPIHSSTRINERGQIAGQWLTDTFQNRGFILTPTP